MIFKKRQNHNFAISLLENKKEYYIFFLIALLLFSISLFREYLKYRDFTKYRIDTKTLFVEQQYPKKNYTVLKLRNLDGFQFYSTTKTKIRDLSGYYIDATLIFGKNFSFWDYLSGGYITIGKISLHSFEKDRRYRLRDKIVSLHKNDEVGELYSAIFLATPIDRELRGKLSRLGINHLAVLSGFHVSFLVLIVSGLGYLIYNKIHQRFFPYRNLWRDILIFDVAFLLIYLIFLETPPSLLRAVVMFLIVSFLFDRNLIQNGFEILLITAISLIALSPKLLFSIGFLFSISGVFYILLYLKYFRFGAVGDMLLVNIWVFVAMLPIVHSIFGEFNTLQLLSPIWTILFSIFYPVAIVIHFTPYPDLLDFVIEWLLNLPSGESFYFETPPTILVMYILISLFLAIRRDP